MQKQHISLTWYSFEAHGFHSHHSWKYWEWWYACIGGLMGIKGIPNIYDLCWSLWKKVLYLNFNKKFEDEIC